jgi:Tol biopolymer transport system component
VSLGLMQRLSHRLTCATIVTSMLRSRVGLQALLAALVSAFVLAAVFLLAGAMRSSAANVSAPSGRIVFVRTATDPHQDDDLGDIYVMNADGTHRRNLTRSLAYYDSVVWAPDHRRIVFAAQKLVKGTHGKWATNIYVINGDGTGFRQLTHTSWNDDPVWSPDSRRIAFVRHWEAPTALGVGTSDIYVVDVDGSDERRVTRDKFDESALGWSSQNKVVFVRSSRFDPQAWSGREIITMKPDGSEKHFLTHNRQAEAVPVWSPDGRSLLFVRWRGHVKASLFAMDADGSNQRKLTPAAYPYDDANEPDVTAPVWSPDGSMIAYPSPVPYEKRNSAGNIYVITAGGTWLHPVAGRDAFLGSWSPDGHTIAFTRHPAIWLVNADGRGQRRLIPRPGRRPFSLHENWLADWAPRPRLGG